RTSIFLVSVGKKPQDVVKVLKTEFGLDQKGANEISEQLPGDAEDVNEDKLPGVLLGHNFEENNANAIASKVSKAGGYLRYE
ncbi:hypothetical protein BGW38_006947, partial [Lunasporangiospora selenospora]